ncbi:hypothetical protein LRP67_12500 [Nocardioides sp. cx-169]|uniref:hypothetical protein n=1 Tax=Nocardioides sp. cx-169 TaxID=2899080 RepID=UPI001E59AF14|nr:hypothetical protein [Nocardioides sp. cx-169]MCD4534907.1 hypothetical protein [Nocardioides sp. cx-169]
MGVRLDVSSDDSVAEAIAELGERLGHLEALVNNAGGGPLVTRMRGRGGGPPVR